MTELNHETTRVEERSSNLARAVWGLLLIWTGAVVFLGWGWGVGLLGGGVILLGAQAARGWLRLEVEGLGLIAGAVLVLCGAGNVFQIAIDLFPLLVVAVGIALLVSAWISWARKGAGARREPQTPVHPRL